jgi:hypothetical protein
MKTSELSGAALDWAVAKCEGLLCFGYRTDGERFAVELSDGEVEGFMPSTDWVQGGEIIEREGIAVWQFDDVTWRAMGKDTVPDPLEGATPLIAAMRCYVASKLGDEVQIPKELTHG